MLWRVTMVVCALGAICAVVSYDRFRWHAGSYSPMSRYWPAFGFYFVGPFVLLAVGAVFGRNRQRTTWATLVWTLVVTSLSLVECLVPIPPPLKDSEIGAGIRLCGVSCVEYLDSLGLAAEGLVNMHQSDGPVDPADRPRDSVPNNGGSRDVGSPFGTSGSSAFRPQTCESGDVRWRA
jgi:hypothetical protein